MQSAFGTVVLVVCGVGVAGAIAALLLNRRTWDEYGRNQLLRDSEMPRSHGRAAAGGDRERDEEIRQMLEARNARRRRRGEPELDVEAELGRLTAPLVDDELRAEIRDLVIARNHRRARQGKAPLDVEAEVQREIAQLAGE
jgi:parvulin-like peptidyl-prolyl isomerase